jgi:hypothetical protein
MTVGVAVSPISNKKPLISHATQIWRPSKQRFQGTVAVEDVNHSIYVANTFGQSVSTLTISPLPPGA